MESIVLLLLLIGVFAAWLATSQKAEDKRRLARPLLPEEYQIPEEGVWLAGRIVMEFSLRDDAGYAMTRAMGTFQKLEEEAHRMTPGVIYPASGEERQAADKTLMYLINSDPKLNELTRAVLREGLNDPEVSKLIPQWAEQRWQDDKAHMAEQFISAIAPYAATDDSCIK